MNSSQCTEWRLARKTDGGLGIRPIRKGSLLTEMVVCTVLLSAVTAVLVPTIAKMIEQRKLIRFDAICLVELDNVAIELQQRAAASEGLTGIKLSESFLKRYPNATLALEEMPGTEKSPLKSVKITIQKPWRIQAPDIRHSLTIWLPTGVQAQNSEESPTP
ncbi:MAG: hypothetical protein JNL58_07835 [Planctomyces sp.]|nr:hypothetical protein [Planctomyces sp.]